MILQDPLQVIYSNVLNYNYFTPSMQLHCILILSKHENTFKSIHHKYYYGTCPNFDYEIPAVYVCELNLMLTAEKDVT